MNSMVDIYKKHLEILLEMKEKHNWTDESIIEEEGWTLGQELTRITTHISRLENDHKECVVACCMGCKLGGLDKWRIDEL